MAADTNAEEADVRIHAVSRDFVLDHRVMRLTRQMEAGKTDVAADHCR